MLLVEYVGLIGVFTAFAFVKHAWIAIGLFILDHVLFSMAIAIKTYFQKIADPADMANTAGVTRSAPAIHRPTCGAMRPRYVLP